MSIYYPTNQCGTGTEAAYACNPCPDNEFGRIRSVAYVKTTYYSTLVAAGVSVSAAWTAGILSGNIIVVWETKGSYDGGTPTELPGFGDAAFLNGDTTHILNYEDRNYADNCDFYNDKKSSTSWIGCYRTKSYIHFTTSPITITAKNAVQDDDKSILTWQVQWKWTYADSPCPSTTPVGIFDACYINQ